MSPLAVVLFVLGYPVAIAVIYRWIPVVRERRVKWFVAHTLAVAAIVAGHAIEDRAGGVAINAAWLVASVLWYALASRKAKQLAQ